MSDGAAPARPAWRSGNVLALGWVSLLTDTSSEMVVPLLPLFLTVTLGSGALALGLIEGLADGVASLLKLWAGRQADRLGRNRPFVVAGYGLASVVRPLIALATAPVHVLVVRVTDRVGKGLRTSPRDALIAASVPAAQRGAAFGFHRAMDHTGAVLGPLLAVAVLTLWTEDLRVVFALSAVPAVAATIAVVLFVREPRTPLPEPPAEASPRPAQWPFLLALAVFTLGNASDTFLLLKAGASRAHPTSLPLLWMGLHMVKVSSATWGGRIADRFGAKRVLLASWVFYAAIYAAMARTEDPLWVGGLLLAYGLYHGLSEPSEKVLVAGLIPEGPRGEVFGRYHLVLGLCGIAASVLFGGVWETVGAAWAFGMGAAFALAASVLLALLVPSDAVVRDENGQGGTASSGADQ